MIALVYLVAAQVLGQETECKKLDQCGTIRLAIIALVCTKLICVLCTLYNRVQLYTSGPRGHTGVASNGSLTQHSLGLGRQSKLQAPQYVRVFATEVSHGLDGVYCDGDAVSSPRACFMPLVRVESDSRQCEIPH